MNLNIKDIAADLEILLWNANYDNKFQIYFDVIQFHVPTAKQRTSLGQRMRDEKHGRKDNR